MVYEQIKGGAPSHVRDYLHKEMDSILLLLATLLAVVAGTLLVRKYLIPSNKQESSGGDSLIAKDNSITIQKVSSLYMEPD